MIVKKNHKIHFYKFLHQALFILFLNASGLEK